MKRERYETAVKHVHTFLLFNY